MRHHLFLLRELVKRDFQGRYAGSLLSFLWSFVQPLWLLVLFTFVFSGVLKLPVQRAAAGTDSFAIFLFCGLLPWTAVQEGLMRSTTAITDNSELVKKLRFPAEILVVSIVLSALLHQAIATGVFLVVLAAVGELSWAHLPWLLLAVPVQVGLTLGIGLLCAPAHVFFRDTAQVLNMALMGWFYVTPIVYPLYFVPDKIAPVIAANPLTALVGLYRTAFLGRDFAFHGSAWGLFALSAALPLAGLWLFRRLKPAFVDEI